MSTRLNDITILVNNDQVAYTANSLNWTDGFGTYVTTNAVLGDGQNEKVFSEDLETKFSTVSWSMPSTFENERFKREWKVGKDNNVVELIGPQGSGFTKIFTLAAILDDPKTSAASDGDIEIEFQSNPAQ